MAKTLSMISNLKNSTQAPGSADGSSAKKIIPRYHSRGYLPHYDAGCGYQMITYRLADALPQVVLKNILRIKNDERKKRLEIEEQLDKSYGSCILGKPAIANIVIENWQWFDRKRYELVAYVVMPNHVHLLIRVFERESLSKIVSGWKSYTSKAIRKYLINADGPSALPGTKGNLINMGKSPMLHFSSRIWQEDYWDRYIRSEEHFNQAIEYIYFNPVKAGICSKIHNWPWSSANRSLAEY